MTNKQRVFIEEYLKCWNATKAARRAKYKNPNVAGSRLLVNDSIKAEIETRIAEKAMGADEVLLRLAEHARSDVGEYIEVLPGGQAIIDLEKAKEAEQLHLIKKLKVTRAGPEIELYDQQAALLNIGKQHGLFTDKHIVSVRLEKEIDLILDAIEKVLSPEDYDRILIAIGGVTEGEETPETEGEG